MAASTPASCQVTLDQPPRFPAPTPPTQTVPNLRLQSCAPAATQHVDNFLYDDEDMPDQPPILVETVLHQLSTPQATGRSLSRLWNVRPDEQTRRALAQPPWKTRMQSAMRETPTLEVVQEEEGETTNQPASYWSTPSEHGSWSPPDGYQSSTSTQRAGDATLLDEADSE